MHSFSTNSFLYDKFAVSTSAVCAIHCLFLPITLSLFPALGSTFLGQEAFHKWLLFLVIPLSLIALNIGCKQHRKWSVMLLVFVGLITLIFTAIYGHDALGHDGERMATLFGVSIIAIGHFLNHRLCRSNQCEN